MIIIILVIIILVVLWLWLKGMKEVSMGVGERGMGGG